MSRDYVDGICQKLKEVKREIYLEITAMTFVTGNYLVKSKRQF